MDRLNERGIPCTVYYPKPLHLQTVSSHLGYTIGDFPEAEDVSCRVFSLPMHSYLEDNDLIKTVDIIRDVQYHG